MNPTDLISYIFFSINGIPNWVRVVVGLFGVTAIVALAMTVSPMVAIIVGAGLLFVGLLVVLFRYLLWRRQQRRAAEFGAEMRQASAMTPGGISDPARRQRLEDLRLSFEKGVEKFRAAGKDLYSLPWYVIVGEPGAGKTEAIRHSQIGFPPGMQDEFQGVGGTINMNWWFTNDAVILDTAGRLLFEEVETGGSGEWRVFLEMLKKHRPHCPINGLILAIPSESLIKDAPEQIEAKAGKIAQQLEVIQKQLDVRYPAFVAITKCDLLNGFREFFDDLTDPASQHQMLGWANPDPLDAAFRPELVDAHIYEVVQRLTRRRLGLMVDPVARDGGGRRADEVDRLYALPHSVNLIGEPLSRYLKAIFKPSIWSQRPPFLRGIFFMSSLREGSALDQELANSLGIDVDQLPEGKAWERDRSYFLRDVFLEKAFPERGLVTKATDTNKLIMKRRLTLFGSAAAALLALLFFSWLGYSTLRQSVGGQSGYWSRASEGWSETHSWKPIVDREASGFDYEGEEPVGQGLKESTRLLFADADKPLEVYHERLRELSATPLSMPMVFRPLASFGVEIDRDRKRAQRVVFEGSVIKPLVEAARARMAGDSGPRDLNATLLEGQALVDLIRLEANIVRRRERKPPTIGSEQFLTPLTKYTANTAPSPELVRTMDAIYYSADGAGAGMWPPDWLNGGWTLADNAAINAGLNRFLKDAREISQSQTGGLPLIQVVLAELRRYAKSEDELAAISRARVSTEETDKAFNESYNRFQQSKQALDEAIVKARNAGLFGDGPVSLVAAYDRLMGGARTRYEIGKAMKAEADDILAAVEGTGTLAAVKTTVQNVTGQSQAYVLFREISDKLRDVMADLESKFRGSLSDQDLSELKTLDEFYLTDRTTPVPHYQARWDLYQTAVKASPHQSHASTLDLIGRDWKPFEEVLTRINAVRTQVQGYQGKLKEKALDICAYCFMRGERVHSDEFCKAWLLQANRKLRDHVRFPLVWEPVRESLKGEEAVLASNLIELMQRDLKSATLAKINSPQKPPLEAFGKKLAVFDPVRAALFTADRNLRLCTVVWPNKNTQFQLAGQGTVVGELAVVQMRAGTIDHGAPVKGTHGRVPVDSGADAELGKFRVDEAFHPHLHKTPADNNPAVDMPWPGDWTALRVLYDYQGQPLEGGRRWRFGVRVTAAKSAFFEIRFDHPLPPFNEWPTFQTLGIEVPRR
jgi:hypothetical protein